MKNLVIKPFIDPELGQAAYLIISATTGLAAIIDPQRDVDRYLEAAQQLGASIVYALDTHLHADFVSGAREIADWAVGRGSLKTFRLGASAEAALAFDHWPLHDGDRLPFGDVTLRVMTTPGHTPEHISFSAAPIDMAVPEILFSGDALIPNGWPDVGTAEAVRNQLAHQLYQTWQAKLLTLLDEVEVYPAHGGPEWVTTIGQERRHNPLALATDEDEFVRLALTELPSRAAYYQRLRRVNQQGARVLGGLPELERLSPRQVRNMMNDGECVIDVRPPRDFAISHIAGAYSLPLTAALTKWLGRILPVDSSLILISDTLEQREHALRQLMRQGYDRVTGYLRGGLYAWAADGLPTAHAHFITPHGLVSWRQHGARPLVLDARAVPEPALDTLCVSLDQLVASERSRLPTDRPLVIGADTTDLASIGLSLLERRGYQDVRLLDFDS